jgi:hypothetical protein
MPIQCLAHTAKVTIILQATSLGSGFETSSGLIHEQDVQNITIAISKMEICYLH